MKTKVKLWSPRSKLRILLPVPSHSPAISTWDQAVQNGTASFGLSSTSSTSRILAHPPRGASGRRLGRARPRKTARSGSISSTFVHRPGSISVSATRQVAREAAADVNPRPVPPDRRPTVGSAWTKRRKTACCRRPARPPGVMDADSETEVAIAPFASARLQRHETVFGKLTALRGA